MTNQWTVDTLREHILTLMEQRFLAQEQAIEKQAIETRENRQKDNEFRNQLKDQTATFPTRAELNAQIKSLEDKVVGLSKNLEDKIASKNLQVMVSLGVGFAGVLIAVFNLASTYN